MYSKIGFRKCEKIPVLYVVITLLYIPYITKAVVTMETNLKLLLFKGKMVK